jgi:membrane-bound lytic murein transglycosylase MltF
MHNNIISQQDKNIKIKTKKIAKPNIKKAASTNKHVIKLSKQEMKYYNFIKKYNSYSYPMSDKQIINLILTLRKCKTDPNILLSIAFVESSFNTEAVSKTGCLGLMQINPIHAKEFGFKNSDFFNPSKSILIADKLITSWKEKNPNITLEGICKKYLGANSKKYYNKIKKHIAIIQSQEISSNGIFYS